MHTTKYQPESVFHPGITLQEKLDELGMGPKEFAVRTGKPEKTITAILKGESSVTTEMAFLFENVLRIPAHFWTNNQRRYDEYMASLQRAEEVKNSIDWAKQFPVNEMVKKQWIQAAKTWEEKTEQLLMFFGVSNPKGWEDYYLKQELKVTFRISLAHANHPYALSAWLRQGELSASKLQASEYSGKKFKDILPEVRALMAKQPSGFFAKLQSMLLSAGVKVVHTPCLPNAPCNGATRWLHETPLIQLSGRYNRNDIFWFTLFHEVGHILLHGKKDIFLEKVEYSDKDLEKEKEADEFAVKWTLSEEEEAEITNRKSINRNDVIDFAKRFNTHPAIIIGRLQHRGLIHHTDGRNLIEPVNLED